MRDDDKIQRQVQFLYAPIFDPQDTTGINNSWFYNRAPEGKVFELISIQISASKRNTQDTGAISIFDGHEYTHWNIWPGVESQELLARMEMSTYIDTFEMSLHGWECKEYTIGIRSLSESQAFKACIIVWYFLRKMSWLERLYYAVIQPKGDRYKKTLGITKEVTET